MLEMVQGMEAAHTVGILKYYKEAMNQ